MRKLLSIFGREHICQHQRAERPERLAVGVVGEARGDGAPTVLGASVCAEVAGAGERAAGGGAPGGDASTACARGGRDAADEGGFGEEAAVCGVVPPEAGYACVADRPVGGLREGDWGQGAREDRGR